MNGADDHFLHSRNHDRHYEEDNRFVKNRLDQRPVRAPLGDANSAPMSMNLAGINAFAVAKPSGL